MPPRKHRQISLFAFFLPNNQCLGRQGETNQPGGPREPVFSVFPTFPRQVFSRCFGHESRRWPGFEPVCRALWCPGRSRSSGSPGLRDPGGTLILVFACARDNPWWVSDYSTPWSKDADQSTSSQPLPAPKRNSPGFLLSPNRWHAVEKWSLPSEPRGSGGLPRSGQQPLQALVGPHIPLSPACWGMIPLRRCTRQLSTGSCPARCQSCQYPRILNLAWSPHLSHLFESAPIANPNSEKLIEQLAFKPGQKLSGRPLPDPTAEKLVGQWSPPGWPELIWKS